MNNQKSDVSVTLKSSSGKFLERTMVVKMRMVVTSVVPILRRQRQEGLGSRSVGVEVKTNESPY